MDINNLVTFVAVATLLVISPGPNGFLLAKTVPMSGHKAGFANIWGFISVANTYFTASIRSGIMELLFEADEDDSLGLRKMISWAEDAWAVIGCFWLILYTIVVFIILGMLVGGAFLLRKPPHN